MADELGEATRALKRALLGKGYVKRVRGVKGIPDFIVAFKSHPRQAVFVELKHENTNIHLIQAATLDELHKYELPAVLLNYTAEKTWAVYFPPFLDEYKSIRCLKKPCAEQHELSGTLLIQQIKGQNDERLEEWKR